MNVFVLISMSTGAQPRVELNFDCFFLTRAWVITSIVHITSSLLKPEDFSQIVEDLRCRKVGNVDYHRPGFIVVRQI
jgi:hypothetical protein